MKAYKFPDRSKQTPSRYIAVGNIYEVIVRKFPLTEDRTAVFAEIFRAGQMSSSQALVDMPLDVFKGLMTTTDQELAAQLPPKMSFSEARKLMLAKRNQFRPVAQALVKEGILDDRFEEIPFPDRPLPSGFVDPYTGEEFTIYDISRTKTKVAKPS